MIVDQNPVVQYRRLRETLRAARLRRDQTQKEVATALDWSRSKLLRIESGAVQVSTTDLRALLDYYGIDDQALVDRLVRTARAAKELPWAEFREVLLPEYQRYLAYEACSVHVQNFQPTLVPGLLQTEQYARATIEGLSPNRSDPEAVTKQIAARRKRQELLAQDDAPRMTFVLDECVIRRTVGGPAVMSAQVAYLRELTRHPRVELRVVPFDAGVHPGMVGSFIVLEFADPLDDIVYVEDLRGALVPREGDQDVTSYKDAFSRLLDLSISGQELDAVLDRVLVHLAAG